MTSVTTPLMLSAAGMRLYGYLIETNLRVAQEFGRAALEANPFLPRLRTRPVAVLAAPQAPATRAEPRTSAPARPKAGPPAQRKTPRQAPAASPAHDPVNVKTEAATEAEQAKRTRAPSKPPAMPESKSTAVTESSGPDQA